MSTIYTQEDIDWAFFCNETTTEPEFNSWGHMSDASTSYYHPSPELSSSLHQSLPENKDFDYHPSLEPSNSVHQPLLESQDFDHYPSPGQSSSAHQPKQDPKPYCTNSFDPQHNSFEDTTDYQPLCQVEACLGIASITPSQFSPSTSHEDNDAAIVTDDVREMRSSLQKLSAEVERLQHMLQEREEFKTRMMKVIAEIPVALELVNHDVEEIRKDVKNLWEAAMALMTMPNSRQSAS